MKKKLGFTLVELMVVVAVIGILAGLLSAAIAKAAANAKRQRRETEVRVLEDAIVNYRNDYNKWPMPDEFRKQYLQEPNSRYHGCVLFGYYEDDGKVYDYWSRSNAEVFDFLSHDNANKTQNPSLKPYLDHRALFTSTADRVIDFNEEQRAPSLRPIGSSWVFGTRFVDYNGKPYRIRINVLYNTVTVDAPWKSP